MKIEHVAFNVTDPPAMAEWYCRHLGFSIKRKMTQPPHGHFLADGSGKVMLELYHNPAAPVPDYRIANSLSMHVAFFVDDVAGACQKLIAVGAREDTPLATNDQGDKVAMLRDPWGLPIQFVSRAKPMV